VATLPRGSSFTANWSIIPSRTGPTNPIAINTRSASIANSVPGIGSNVGGGPTRTACSCWTSPVPELEPVIPLHSINAN
jgi:hypothetical protein